MKINKLRLGIGIFLIYSAVMALLSRDLSSFIVLTPIGVYMTVREVKPLLKRMTSAKQPGQGGMNSAMPENKRRAAINGVKTEYMKIFRLGIEIEEANRRCEEFAEAVWIYQYYLCDRSAYEELLSFAESEDVFYAGTKYPPGSVSSVIQDQRAMNIYFGSFQ